MSARPASPHEPDRSLVAAFHDRLLETVRSLKIGGDLIELGCASGTLTVRLAEARPDLKIIGVDPSTDRLRRATEVVTEVGLNGRIRFERADLATLPLPDQAGSIVVAAGCLDAVANPQALLSEVHRVLRHGGTAVLVDAIPEAGRGAREGTLVPQLARLTHDEDSLRAAVRRSPFKDQSKASRLSYEGGTFLELVLTRPVPPERPTTSWRLS